MYLNIIKFILHKFREKLFRQNFNEEAAKTMEAIKIKMQGNY